MKKEMRKCAVCGKKFTPKTANATVCSDKCRKVNKAKRDKARKTATKSVTKNVKKTNDKPAVKKPAKKAVKAVCKEKIALPKNVKRIVIKEISPEKMLAFAIVAFIKSLKELGK